jgi:hypothetical protein
MKHFLSFLVVVLGLSFHAEAKTVYLDEVIAKATAVEKDDLIGLLEDIKIVPTKKQKNGWTLFKVEMVAKGSVYDREGIKVGDFVFAQGAKKSSKSMNIESSLTK